MHNLVALLKLTIYDKIDKKDKDLRKALFFVHDNKCHVLNKQCNNNDLEIDHIIPASTDTFTLHYVQPLLKTTECIINYMPCSREQNLLKSDIVNNEYINKVENNFLKSVEVLELYKSLKLSKYGEKNNFLMNEVLKKIVSEFGRLKFGNNTNTKIIIDLSKSCIDNSFFSTVVRDRIFYLLREPFPQVEKLHHYVLIGLMELLNPNRRIELEDILLLTASFYMLIDKTYEKIILENFDILIAQKVSLNQKKQATILVQKRCKILEYK